MTNKHGPPVIRPGRPLTLKRMEPFEMSKIASITCAAVFAAASIIPASAEPQYKLNKAQTQVVALSGLSSGIDCHPFTDSGRVTKQTYDGPRVIGFTLAEKDGGRTYINVDPIDLDSAGSMLAAGWINDGLQRMLRKGKTVAIRGFACGAAGRVLMLDAVRSQ